MVLNTKARGSPPASAGTSMGSTAVSPLDPTVMVAGRSRGEGPISTRKSARRSMPISRWPSRPPPGTPTPRRCRRAACAPARRASATRPRGSARAWRRRPPRCPRPGCRGPGARAPPCRRGWLGVGHPALVDVRGIGEQVGDAPEPGLLPDGQLQRRDAGAQPVAQLGQRGVVVGRSRSSLLTNTMRGTPSPAARRHAASVWTSTPSTALTTNTARSAMRSAADTSP